MKRKTTLREDRGRLMGVWLGEHIDSLQKEQDEFDKRTAPIMEMLEKRDGPLDYKKIWAYKPSTK